MDIYLVQLSKMTAKALMPSYPPSSFNNIGREEAFKTIIPEINLRPKGGYWFIVIAERNEDIQRFIDWGKEQKAILSSTKKREEDRMILDLTKYNQEEQVKEREAHNLGRVKVKTGRNII